MPHPLGWGIARQSMFIDEKTLKLQVKCGILFLAFVGESNATAWWCLPQPIAQDMKARKLFNDENLQVQDV